MPSETLQFDILGNAESAKRAFRETGDSAGVASKAAEELKKKLDELKGKSATARILLEGSKEARVALDQLDAKLVTLDARTSKPNIKVEGVAKAAAELSGLDLQLDKVGASSGNTGGLLSKLAGSGGGAGGIAALIGAAVAVSPIVATLGLGLGGLGLAAYGASQNTRLMHQELAPLKSDLGQFSRALQPEVLTLFGQAAGIAAGFLKQLEPVAAATGKGLEGVLGAVGAEFRSGEWQNFFGFMGRTAAPDMALLGKLFVDLLKDVPPLLESLQPLARGILTVADGTLKLVGDMERLHLLLPLIGGILGFMAAGPVGAAIGALGGLAAETQTMGQQAQSLSDRLSVLPSHVQLAAAATINWSQVAKGAKSQVYDTATNTGVLGDKAAYAAPKVGTLAGDMALLSANTASGNSQLAAYLDLWQKFVGAAVSDQQAVLNVAQAFNSYDQTAANSKKTSAQVQLAFLSIFDAIGTGLDTLHKNNASVSQVNDFYKTSISRLQSLHGLNATQRADIQGLIKDYEAWASSTQGLDKNTVRAASDIANQYVVALQGAHHWTPQVSGDMTAFAASILKTGDGSRSTAGDRAKLIADLEKAGLSAKDARGYAQAFQQQIDLLHGKAVNVELITSGKGVIEIVGTGITTRTINTTTGQVNTIGGHTAKGWLVSGGVQGQDSVPIMAMPGELVVPTAMVRAGAVDHLRGKIPGFAGGGVVGKVAGAEGAVGTAEAQWGQLAATAFASAALKAAQAAAAAAAGAAGGFTPGAPASGSAAAAQAFARSILPAGWSWPALDALWTRESGWNAWAVNPTSGAYGIPQSLGHGHPYNLGDYANQVRWGIGYIGGRYGNSQNAWAHEVNFGWYDRGGSLAPGFTLAYNGTGRAEQVLPAGAGAGSGGSVTIVIENRGVIGSKAEAEAWLVDGINSAARQGKLTWAFRRSPSAA